MGSRFVQIYGQGESPMTITALSRAQLADDADPRWPERIESVGVAQALVEVRVVDGDGSDLPIGATGEIVVRGDTVMAATGATRRRPRRRCATAGCGPATSARSTTTAS
jgi:long-chain acyl-CoA synthetase